MGQPDAEDQLDERAASRAVPFTQIPNALLRDPNVPPDARDMLALMMSFVWTGEIPSQAELAQMRGKSVDYVQRQQAVLKRLGLLPQSRRGSKVKAADLEAAKVRYLRGREPQIRSVQAADLRPGEAAGVRSDYKDKANTKHHDRRAAPDAVVLETQAALRELGVRLGGGLLRKSGDLARRWIAVYAELRADDVPALIASGIRNGFEPPASAVAAHERRLAADAARDREDRALADREAAETRTAAEEEQAKALVAELAAEAPLILAGLKLCVKDTLLGEAPAFVHARLLAARVASLATATAADGAWLAVVVHDEGHAQPGEAPPPAFSGRCAGCCQVRKVLARWGDAG